MKSETAAKLKELVQSQRVKFEATEKGIEVDFDLTDEELREFVELEYGQTTQDVVQLFQCILKTAIKLAREN
jgi:N-methylhydantoinase B/oxoprolinase/acetone carboxylase alpha subunit